uniref:Uncharacterized protein n=1 Tax=Oryza punctata TaxID=4537 RepID=A0A0E0JKF0_ORYPU
MEVATYIGQAMHSVQGKRCTYNFNHHWICSLLYPEYGEVVVLDSLDMKATTYQDFLIFLDK